MKPNDKAIDAGFEASAISVNGSVFGRVSRSTMKEILEAAYAAQFQSEDYAGLVERLRSQDELYVEKCVGTHDVDENKIEPLCNEAADALEALLAEREVWKRRQEATAEILKQVETERDALLACLAPVEDDALVEIVAVYCSPEMNWNEMSEKWKNSCRRDARAAIAAIRPHIEAAERERCAKIAEARLRTVIDLPDGYINGWEQCQRSIAAAIRRGK